MHTHTRLLAIHPFLKYITTSPLSVSTSDCMLIKDMKVTITDSLGSHKCSFLDPRFKTNALPGTTSTIAQLKAEAKEIVESPDGAAGPEGAPPPPRKSKGLTQSHTQRSVVATVILVIVQLVPMIQGACVNILYQLNDKTNLHQI